MKRRQSLLLRLARYFVGYKLTPLGRAVVVAIFFSATGAVSIEIPIYEIFCGLLALLGISEMTGLIFRPRLEVEGWIPERATAGETAQGYVTVRSCGWFPAFDVMCGLFNLPGSVRQLDGDASIPALRRGERATLKVKLQTEHRGVYPLPDVNVHSTFPFNLMRFGGTKLPTKSLTVLPAFHRLEEFQIPLSQRYQPGGVALESRLGQSPEYVGNREYIPGEPARRLDFRAWARLGKPVVREYQEEFCSRVALILDTYRPPGVPAASKGHRAFEAAVSITASVAQALHDTDSIIDVFAAGPELYIFHASAGSTHFESVLEILAAVESTRRNPFEKISPAVAESLESISTAVCVLLDWDESREQLTRQILEAGCSMRVIIVRSGPTSSSVPDDIDVYTMLAPDAVLEGRLSRL